MCMCVYSYNAYSSFTLLTHIVQMMEFTYCSKLGREASMLDSRTAVQKDLDMGNELSRTSRTKQKEINVLASWRKVSPMKRSGWGPTG